MGSKVIAHCQSCSGDSLISFFFAGWLPPVNTLRKIGHALTEEERYPAEMLFCRQCSLVQLGVQVDPNIVFPPDYAYLSGTTKLLRDNFLDLCQETVLLFPQVEKGSFVVDIGCNDGTLLSCFKNAGYRVLGVEPTKAADRSTAQGIDTWRGFFTPKVAETIVSQQGKAHLVTATNVFAHVPDVHGFLHGVNELLRDDGLFVTESHYLPSLLSKLQYDTVYHEHLRYYSLTSLKYLLETHGMRIIWARHVPTHGGSVRVYAQRTGRSVTSSTVESILSSEKDHLELGRLTEFSARVSRSKSALHRLLADARGDVFGIGAPSRAVTLVNHVGIDETLVESVVEVEGSKKIGHYLPGTKIPIVSEQQLYERQPAYALLLSWHLADELMVNLRGRGYKGSFIIPLPTPIVINKVVP